MSRALDPKSRHDLPLPRFLLCSFSPTPHLRLQLPQHDLLGGQVRHQRGGLLQAGTSSQARS